MATGRSSASPFTPTPTQVVPIAQFQPKAEAWPWHRFIRPGRARTAWSWSSHGTTELLVDGHRAVRLALHANPDTSCPDGRIAQFQPKAETGDWHRFIRPGDTHSLVIVELAGATLMFEVLPAPHPQELRVIDSIRFLEQLPTTP